MPRFHYEPGVGFTPFAGPEEPPRPPKPPGEKARRRRQKQGLYRGEVKTSLGDKLRGYYIEVLPDGPLGPTDLFEAQVRAADEAIRAALLPAAVGGEQGSRAVAERRSR